MGRDRRVVVVNGDSIGSSILNLRGWMRDAFVAAVAVGVVMMGKSGNVLQQQIGVVRSRIVLKKIIRLRGRVIVIVLLLRSERFATLRRC